MRAKADGGRRRLRIEAASQPMSKKHSEILVIVERDTGVGIEMREVVMEGDKAFLVFARSDGTDCRIEIDPAKIRPFRIKPDFQYRGGAIKAPQQEMGT